MWLNTLTTCLKGVHVEACIQLFNILKPKTGDTQTDIEPCHKIPRNTTDIQAKKYNF